jgi:hypothetical protein
MARVVSREADGRDFRAIRGSGRFGVGALRPSESRAASPSERSAAGCSIGSWLAAQHLFTAPDGEWCRELPGLRLPIVVPSVLLLLPPGHPVPR